MTRWCLTIPGLLASLALAAAGCVLVPPQYTSSGTVVLVQPNQRGANSLLTSGESLGTTALILVQTLNVPQVALDLGLAPNQESFIVKNGSTSLAGKVTETTGPFISVTAQSPSPDRSTAIAGSVLARAGSELKDLQTSLKVRTKNNIVVETVVDASPPKLAWDLLLRTVGLALFVGIVITIGLVCAFDRTATRIGSRRARRLAHKSAPPTYKTSTESTRPVSDPPRTTSAIEAGNCGVNGAHIHVVGAALSGTDGLGGIEP
jgi:capsular polysaccharide biosynthesis protein